MARKKLSKESRNQPQERNSPRDLCPVEKPQSLIETKSLETLNQNLKTLNQMLAKETMENRFQIESLKSEIEERSAEEPLLFDIERGIYRMVVSSAVSEEKAAAAEDMGRKLEARVRVLKEEMERNVLKSGEDFNSLKRMMEEEMERNVEKVTALEGELRRVVEMECICKAEFCALKNESEGLERENSELKGEVDELREKKWHLEVHTKELALKLDELGEKIEKIELEKKGLVSEIVLLEKRNGELKGDVGRLLENVNGLEKEEEEVKMNFEAKFREYASKLDELGEKIEKVELEKKGLVSEIILLEKRNVELKGDVGRFLDNINGLEKGKEEEKMNFEAKFREYALELDGLRERIGVIEQEKCAVEQAKVIQELEIIQLKKEATKLNSSLLVLHKLEKRNVELEGEVNRLLAYVSGLEKEKEEKETALAANIRELDDLRERMSAIVLEKDAIVQTTEDREVVILELKEEVMKLNSRLLKLKDSSTGYIKKNAELQADRDALIFEKEVLSKQKAQLEKTLLAAQAKCMDMEGKMRASEITSSKALSLLKGTVETMNRSVEAREIGAVDDDEKIRPFVGELESIRTAHHNRVARMEEMNQELEVMKSAVADERKKRTLWTWLYPVTSAFVAAISFAYAAKAR